MTTETPPTPGERFAEWLSQNLRSGEVRSALRQADMPQNVVVAYPYLARWLPQTGTRGAYQREAMLSAAAVIARTGVKHRPGVAMGSAFHTLRARKAISPDSLDMMIAQIYRTPIRTCGRTIESLLRLAAAHNIPVDYSKVVDAFRWWDVNPYAPTSQRRRILNDYYTYPAKPKPSDEDTSPSDQPAAGAN